METIKRHQRIKDYDKKWVIGAKPAFIIKGTFAGVSYTTALRRI